MRRSDDVLGAFALAMTAWGLARMARFASATHALPRVADPAPSARVSAVVPARDEAASAARCLEALLATGVAEVVVVDDGSTDGTAEVARAYAGRGVRVVTAPLPPRGALGKPVACATGAAVATGEWLWFVDADVTVAPDALARLLAAADESGAALVSAFGRVEQPGWLDPEIGLSLARRLSLDAVRTPGNPLAFAAGHCLLVSRAAYVACGGHGAVADAVAEDIALAKAVKDSGFAIAAFLAPDAFGVRLYSGTAATWRGLLKNSLAVRGTGPAAAAREAAWAVSAAAPLLLARRNRLARAALVLQVVTSAGGRLVARQPVAPAVAAPVAELILVANWLAALLARRRGATVDWRGRAVRPDAENAA